MLNKLIFILILLMIISMISISYIETTPEYSAKIVDTGTVLESGCVNSTYKGNTTYDCSTKVQMNKKGISNIILKFGVLPGDKINKVCRKSLQNNKVRCWYDRA